MPFNDDVALQGDIEIARVLVDRNWCTERHDGTERPSSVAFLDSLNEASCFILAETNLNLIAAQFPGKKLGVVTVAAARDAGFIVARDPAGGNGIPGHVVLVQTAVRPQGAQHTKRARQLANSGRVLQLSGVQEALEGQGAAEGV
jgi:hypothetical protein